MESAKMRRGLVMLTFIVLYSHRPATAKQTYKQQVEAAWRTTSESMENDSCIKFLLCVKKPSSSCITECCDSFNFKAPPPKKCICWRIAERINKQALTALQNYCGVKPPNCPDEEEIINEQQVIESTNKAIEKKVQQVKEVSTCCAKDKDKIKNCMFNTTSIDQCCPTFNIMLGRNCGCYNYAEDLDNQILITLESYCDVANPCNTAQVM